MNEHIEFLQDLMDATKNLPEAKRVEALEEVVASALNLMDRDTILDLRRVLDAALVRHSEHQSLLDLIEGHLALRDIEQQPEPLPERDILRR